MVRRTNRPANAVAPAGPASPEFRIADYPFYLIARVAGLYARRLERALKPHGMDQPRWRVLMILAEHNGASMGLVAELAVMKLPTLFKVVRRMQEAGLVEATPRASDQRFIDVRITAAGRRQLVFIKQAAASAYAEASAGLADDELRGLNEVLKSMAVNLQPPAPARIASAAQQPGRRPRATRAAVIR